MPRIYDWDCIYDGWKKTFHQGTDFRSEKHFIAGALMAGQTRGFQAEFIFAGIPNTNRTIEVTMRACDAFMDENDDFVDEEPTGFEERTDWHSCRELPGPEKVAAMRRRVELGLPLFHEGDPKPCQYVGCDRSTEWEADHRRQKMERDIANAKIRLRSRWDRFVEQANQNASRINMSA